MGGVLTVLAINLTDIGSWSVSIGEHRDRRTRSRPRLRRWRPGGARIGAGRRRVLRPPLAFL
jgi:hypothetical protein